MLILIIKLILFVIFLGLIAYFSSTETALTSLSTLNLKNMKEKHPKITDNVLFWEKKPNEILATILVGINLTVIGAGVLSTSIALDLAGLGRHGKLVFAAVPVMAAILILILGEIIPKNYSRYNSEAVALRGFSGLLFFNGIFRPVTTLLLKLSDKIINMSGVRMSSETPFLKPEELRLLLLSEETSPLSKPERRLVDNILDFGKTRISRVMVPRDGIQAVNLDQEYKKIISQLIEKAYSRIPVYRGNLDNIVGIIYSKDLNLALRREALVLVEDIIRPAYFVPESARVDKVLREFKTGHYHMAVVVDEFGSTVGLATIEDLVEEIVGDIWDEYDLQEKTIFPVPDGGFLLRANESLDKVNEELKLNLPAGEFNTISGWVLDLFGRIPKVGEKIRWGDIEVEIIDATRTKVSRVKIKKVS